MSDEVLRTSQELPEDPRSAGYDSVKLVLVKNKRPKHVFDDEAVDPNWAPQMTERIGRWAAEVLAAVPGAEIRELACRTSSCKLVLFAPSRDAIGAANKALYAKNQSNMMGVVGTEEVEGGYVRPFYLLFSDYRDIEAHKRRFGL